MARSTKPLSNDLRWAIARMRHVYAMPTKEIARQTGVNIRTVQRVLQRFEDTGDIASRMARSSRTKVISGENAQVRACARVLTPIFSIPDVVPVH